MSFDVEVLDKNHRPVRGLTAVDFAVTEDGKPQTVAVLHEVDLDEAPPSRVAWMTDVTPDVTTNSVDGRARVAVILIDDALIPNDPFVVKNTKAIVARIVGNLGPKDRVAVVFSADNRRTQDFTSDHATLLAAATQFHPGWANWAFKHQNLPSDDPYWAMSLRTLSAVVQSLAAVPDRRKNVYWISPGVPLDPALFAPQSIGAPSGGAPSSTGGAPVAAAQTPSMSDVQGVSQLPADTARLFDQAQRANVAIDPIDPTGLGGLELYISSYTSASHMAVLTDPVAHAKATLSLDYLETAAASTGGHAIANTNDPLPGVDQIFQESGTYYMLGFRPFYTKADGTLRRVEVKVTRAGLEVHARTGYYAPRAVDGAAAAEASSENAILGKAIGGLLPDAGLPLGVTLAPFALPGQHTAAVAVALGVSQPVPDEAAKAKVTETTELQISAFTPDGDPRGTQRSTAHVQLTLGATGEAQYEVLGRIDLPPGRYALRLAAHDATSRKTGSVAASLVVPDFTNDAFTMSGVVVSRTPGRKSAPRELLTPLLPIVPTADREFAASDQVATYLQLYQSGKKPVGAASVLIRVQNGQGGTDIEETRRVDVGQFTSGPTKPSAGLGSARLAGQDPFANAWLRAADVRYDVPMARLGAGAHLLTFEATCGTTTLRRDVRFDVR